MKALHTWEFDNFPKDIGSIAIIDTEFGFDIILKIGEGEDKTLLSSLRDQWGVFHAVGFIGENGNAISQEDETRSFLHAFASALIELRKMSELSKDSTKL